MTPLTPQSAMAAELAINAALRVTDHLLAPPHIVAGLRTALDLVSEARHAAWVIADLRIAVDREDAESIRREVAARWASCIAEMPR